MNTKYLKPITPFLFIHYKHRTCLNDLGFRIADWRLQIADFTCQFHDPLLVTHPLLITHHSLFMLIPHSVRRLFAGFATAALIAW